MSKELVEDYKFLREKLKEIRDHKERGRIDYVISILKSAGYDVTKEDKACLSIAYRGSKVLIYPYTGWFTGKTVKDGRGIRNLLKQIGEV